MRKTQLARLMMALLVFGCSGQISQPRSNGGDRAGGAGGGGDTNSAGRGGTSATSCADSDVRPGAAMARRLTRREYENSVRDLFKGITIPDLGLLPDKIVDGFDNSAVALAETPELLEKHSQAARRIAEAIATPLQLMGCGNTATAACADAFLKGLGARILRRPLEPEEQTRYRTFFLEQAKKYDATVGARQLIQALLMAPSFLYRIDTGEPDPGDPKYARLGGYEIASRLSYFLWQSTPDPALMEAAGKGELDGPEGIESQARRLLADARARLSVNSFETQWLDLEGLPKISRDTGVFPKWKPTTAEALDSSTRAFLEKTFWEGDGTVSSMLTSPVAFVNQELAGVYDVPPPSESGLVQARLDPAQRMGLLTQAGVMARLAHARVDAPILRGSFVLRRLLCMPPPAPPPNIMEKERDLAVAKTTRQHFEQTHTGASCRGCHQTMDGIGFMFSNYDGIGGYRTQENGEALNAAVSLTGLGAEYDGDYANILEFIPKLAASEQVALCGAAHVFRFAMARTDEENDACAIEQASRASRGSLREFFIALTRSETFRAQLVGEP